MIPRANSEDSFSTGGFQPPSSSGLSSSYNGSETDDSLSISIDQDRTPFEQRLHGVEQAIDRLYRLSLAIRRPSIISQNAKAANFVIRDEDGNDINEQFIDYYMKFITSQFPESSQVIRERLANSITLRRKRFLYRQSHQQKLSTKSILSPPPLARSPSSPSIQHEVESTVIARTVIESPAQAHNKDQKLFKPKLLSQTSASKFTGKVKIEDIFQSPSRTPTMFSGAFTQQANISFPDPPKLSLGVKEFECPYCYMMLPITEAAPSNWR